MLYFYQHLPQHINPISFSIGSFQIRWYSIMYLVGFAVVYSLLIYRNREFRLPSASIIDFLLCSFVGLIIGGRLGYVLFYNLGYYIQNPLAIISPFNSGSFVGIFGMSYFGGLIGIIIAAIIFCKSKKIDFWKWSDFVIPAIPAGYFFGRIGNFLNGELYGKATNHWWGMYFSDGILRHPTQLYEATLEGLLLFSILWFLKDKTKIPGSLLALYIAGYGVIRFSIEFLREQEGALIMGMTVGQLLSLAALIISVSIFLNIKFSIFKHQFSNKSQ